MTSALYLRIVRGSTSALYRVVPLPERAWRFARLDTQDIYDIHTENGQHFCTCGDFVMRGREWRGENCKHIAAALENGLLREEPVWSADFDLLREEEE